MQQTRKKKPAQEMRKPIMQGSWHGKDAWRLGRRRSGTVLAVGLVYMLLGLLLSFDSVLMRIVMCVLIVGMAGSYLYSQGLAQGEGDAAFGEIMYQRQQEGKPIPKEEKDRCFHPAKGFFAVAVGALPFVVILAVYAFLAKPAEYQLGSLPSWLGGLVRQSEFGLALQYYQNQAGIGAVDILRVVARALVMPFINVAVGLGDDAILLVERLSPLLVLVAPLGYGLGYRGGLKARARIHAGIAAGDRKKKRREQKARKQRARSNTPERLI